MPRSTPAVTVIIPTFEQAKFIGRALDSLQAQSLTDWEGIIIDDGSHDATKDVVTPLWPMGASVITACQKTRGWAVP
jgi:hypothetical protein